MPHETATESTIKLKDVNYRLKKKSILKNINLTIETGDFWLFFGPNGAGKTTLLKTLCGLIHHFEGRISIQDRPIASFSPRELATLISYQPQFAEFSLPINIKDILLAGRYPYKSFLKITPGKISESTMKSSGNLNWSLSWSGIF